VPNAAVLKEHMMEKTKQAVVSLMLDEGREILLGVVAPLCELPAFLRGTPPDPEIPFEAGTVFLHIGRALANPIPDLVVDAVGVSATLHFADGFHLCKLPWEGIYQMTDLESGNTVLWLKGATAEERAGLKERMKTKPKLSLVE
jgi:hypothetical protein